MNARRGMFRLWVVFSVLFAIGIAVTSYNEIRHEFRVADTDFDALAEKYGGYTVLPAGCVEARGVANRDYSRSDGLCWYKVEDFRRLYPEYNSLTDRVLADRLYQKAGRPLQRPHPWQTVLQTGTIAVGVPLAVLAVGCAMTWAFSGFRVRSS